MEKTAWDTWKCLSPVCAVCVDANVFSGGKRAEEQIIVLSKKALNRPRAIPVPCAEVYFWNGAE